MILIALGSNLESPRFGSPRDTCEAALQALGRTLAHVVRRSRWYCSPPVPASDQPWYVNGVAHIETSLDPESLLATLHRIEDDFGRRRAKRNEARIIDLDLLAFHEIVSGTGAAVHLPHPRMCERAFVLMPLAELAPNWRHPVSGRSAAEILGGLPADQSVAPIEDDVP